MKYVIFIPDGSSFYNRIVNNYDFQMHMINKYKCDSKLMGCLRKIQKLGNETTHNSLKVFDENDVRDSFLRLLILSRKILAFERNELKFLVSKDQLNKFLNIVNEYMDKEKYYQSTIRNIYYDTDNFYLIRNSIEKPEYKEKFRVRAYKQVSANDEVFVEIKKKYRKTVFKRREVMTYNEARLFLDEHIVPNDLRITKEIDYAINYYKDLKPAIFLAYDRIAYISKDDTKLRITFDSNITWRDYDIDLSKEVYGNKLLSDDLLVMEVKTTLGLPRWLLDFLGENRIYKQSFSKYGNVYLEILKNKRKEVEKNDK